MTCSRRAVSGFLAFKEPLTLCNSMLRILCRRIPLTWLWYLRPIVALWLACYSLIGTLNGKAKSKILSLKSIGHGFIENFSSSSKLNLLCFCRNLLYDNRTTHSWTDVSQSTLEKEMIAYLCQRKVVISRGAYSCRLSIIVKMEISIMGSETGDKQRKIEKIYSIAPEVFSGDCGVNLHTNRQVCPGG